MSHQLSSKTLIKNYPYLANSPHLIDYFLIIGYDPNYIKNKLIPTIREILSKDNSETFPKNDEFLPYTPHEYPEVLTSISSDYSGEMLCEDDIIKFSFPSPPSILITTSRREEINRTRTVFYVNNDSFKDGLKKMTNGFTYVFHENQLLDIPNKKEVKLLIPKSFTFISQFPFFNAFDTLANHIHKFFINPDGLEIPLEILLYNIVNFIPSPISASLKIQFLPTTNTSIYAQKILEITKKQKKELRQEFEKNPLETEEAIKLDDEKFYTFKVLQSLQGSSTGRLKFDQLNVYPYYDYNLAEIFSVLPLNTLIQAFVYMFLDQEMLVFSRNLEMLNMTLYIITSLNYPFTDSMYLWHIISLRKEELLKRGSEASPYVGKFFSSILGFNCKYDSSVKTDIHYKKPHFIVDLDEKVIHYKRGSDYLFDDSDSDNGNEEDKELKGLNEYECMEKLMVYMQKIFDGKKLSSFFLEKAIKELMQSLTPLYDKIISREEQNASQRFFSKEPNIAFQNKTIQEAFYQFIMNILKTFYECYTLKGMNTIKSKKTFRRGQTAINTNQFPDSSSNRNQPLNRNVTYSSDDPQQQSRVMNTSDNDDTRTEVNQSSMLPNNMTMASSENDDVNENPEQKTYYLHYNDKSKYKSFSKEEKIFARFLKASNKFGTFFKSFIESDEISELYRIPLMFVEEFMNLIKKKCPQIKELKCLNMMDYFNPQYSNTQIHINLKINESKEETKPVNINDLFIEIIDFRNFYAYYDLKMKNFIYEESLNYPHISTKKANVFNLLSTKYKYRSIELSNHLIQKYDYYLSNLSIDELKQTFPSLETQQENAIENIELIKISKAIEKALIENKVISNQELIVYSILNVIGMFIDSNNENDAIVMISDKEAEDVEELLREGKYCMRSYLTMLVLFLYSRAERKIRRSVNNKKKVDISNELRYFQILFDSLRTSNEIPTKLLKFIADSFDELEKEFYKLMTSFTNDNENENVDDDNNNNHKEGEFEMKIKEEETNVKESQDKYRKMIKLLITKCECEDDKKYDDDYFCTLTKNVQVKKNISYKCEDCESTICPSLECLGFDCDMFSPFKTYEETTKMLEEFKKDLNQNEINTIMCLSVIVNLIYYASIFPNFKYSTCDILIRIFKQLLTKV